MQCNIKFLTTIYKSFLERLKVMLTFLTIDDFKSFVCRQALKVVRFFSDKLSVLFWIKVVYLK